MKNYKLFGITEVLELTDFVTRMKNVYVSHLENDMEMSFEIKKDFVFKVIGSVLLEPTNTDLMIIQNPTDLFIKEPNEIASLLNDIKTTLLGALVRGQDSVIVTGKLYPEEKLNILIENIFDEIMEYEISEDLDSGFLVPDEFKMGDEDSLNTPINNKTIVGILEEITRKILENEKLESAKSKVEDFAQRDDVQEVKGKTKEALKGVKEKAEEFSQREEVKEAKDKTKEALENAKEKAEEFLNRKEVQETKSKIEKTIFGLYNFAQNQLGEMTKNVGGTDSEDLGEPVDFSAVDSTLNEENAEYAYIQETLYNLFEKQSIEFDSETANTLVNYIIEKGKLEEKEFSINYYHWGNYAVVTAPIKVGIDGAYDYYDTVMETNGNILFVYLVKLK